MSSSARLAAAVTVARSDIRATRPARPDYVTHATKATPPGALVVDAVTGQIGEVIYASTKHLHTDAAEK